jgi:hypothetical protein
MIGYQWGGVKVWQVSSRACEFSHRENDAALIHPANWQVSGGLS